MNKRTEAERIGDFYISKSEEANRLVVEIDVHLAQIDNLQGGDAERVCERLVKQHRASIKVLTSKLEAARYVGD